MKSKSVLFITTRLFWPPDSGRKVVLWNYCKGLAEQYGYDIYLYSFLEGDQNKSLANDPPEFISHVEIANELGSMSKAFNLIELLSVNRECPLQCGLYCDKTNEERIRQYIKEIHPSAVIVDMLRLAPYISALNQFDGGTIINFDDLLSKRYEKQASMLTSKQSGLGRYSEKASFVTKLLMRVGGLKRRVFKTEARRASIAEQSYAEQYDASLLISPIEAAELRLHTDPESVFVATMGAEAYQYIEEAARKIEFDLAFVGNMSYAPNQESVRIILEEIIPKMDMEVSLRVIGVCPNDFIEDFKSFKNVSFTGRVKSIRSELLKCRVFLAPIPYGTGIKTKILEAMGMGLPVVTNSIGVEGLQVSSGYQCMVGGNSDEMADEAQALLRSAHKREVMGIQAIEYIKTNHQWTDSINELEKCIEYSIRKASGETINEKNNLL